MESPVELQSFSSDGSLIAFCNQGNNAIKVWNTKSGELEHEFQPASYLSSAVSCLKFNIINTSKSQKKKSSTTHDDIFAMGTVKGSVLIYNYTKRNVTATLKHSSHSSVTDIDWVSPDELLTIGKSKLILWNISSKEKKYTINLKNQDIKGQCRGVCHIGPNSYAVTSDGISYMKYNTKSEETSLYRLAAFKPTVQILPILFPKDKEARYVVSASQNDRFIDAWSTQCQDNKSVKKFRVEDVVVGFCSTIMVNSSVALAAWTKKGSLRYYVQQLNGSTELKSPVHSKGILSYATEEDGASLPIIGAYFVSNALLLVVYGNKGLPQFEQIKLEALKGTVKYVRKDPRKFNTKKSHVVGVQTPSVPEHTTYFMTGQYESTISEEGSLKNGKKRKIDGIKSNLTMESRLNSMAITHSVTGLPKGIPLDNHVHRLVQALRSNDSTLLNSVLLKGEEDPDVINSTVRKLPVSFIVPFLQSLQEIIAGKGLKNISLVNWIKAVFEHHMSHLSSMPNKDSLMKPFYTICDSRVSTLPTVSRLHSRVHLLLTHVKNRHANASIKGDHVDEALLVYRDDDSSDDDLGISMGGGHPSESEDTWDYLSEEEQDNDDDDDDDNDIVELMNGDDEEDWRKRPHEDTVDSEEDMLIN